MLVGIQEEILRLNSLGLLNRLLKDKTTGTNIVWATDAYQEHGKGYEKDREISVSKITDDHANVIKNRARKELEQQSDRIRAHAEVFTPLWVCRKMNDHIDEVWFGRPNVFSDAKGAPTEKVEFPEGKTWKEYVDSRRMEITCGEAPFLVSRYDVSTGEILGREDHVGILDRKLRVVNENAKTKNEWMTWAIRAFESTYGYEFQGDNVLIARLNLLLTFEEYLRTRWKRKPKRSEYQKIINVIVWNIWQMDGLTEMTPRATREYVQLLLPGYSEGTRYRQMDLFDDTKTFDSERIPEQLPCQIFDWRSRCRLKFSTLSKMKKKRFDFIIGNPPYQDETIGDNTTFAPPLYHKFIDASYSLADRVALIHPARFLFNAGSTPKAWNRQMLNNPHVKVLWYEPKSGRVFPNIEIMGGIAETYYSANEDFGAIETFTAFPELNGTLRKVKKSPSFESLSTITYSAYSYHFTDKMHKDYPEAKSLLSKGHAYDLKSNAITKLGKIFFEEKPSDGKEYIRILGRDDNCRILRYIRKDYVTEVDNLNAYKVFIAGAHGSGAIGETVPTPLIGAPVEGTPLMGNTESFISIGKFKTKKEATSCLKYVKTKFARAMLGILKVTQAITPEKWEHVPLQDFTGKSDIDWSKSVQEIDQQLYKKYGLNRNEIKFIEEKVQEMK